MNYGHNTFGKNTAYQTRNLKVTSHHPLGSAKSTSLIILTAKPDSPNGFWELSEQIFNRISHKSDVANALGPNFTISQNKFDLG